MQALVTSAVAFLALGLDAAGSTWLIIALAVLNAVLGSALGLLASAFASSEFQAVQFMPAFVLPQILLCGLLVPLDQMAGWLEAIASILPLTFAFEALDAVAVDGDALADVAGQVGVLARHDRRGGRPRGAHPAAANRLTARLRDQHGCGERAAAEDARGDEHRRRAARVLVEQARHRGAGKQPEVTGEAERPQPAADGVGRHLVGDDRGGDGDPGRREREQHDRERARWRASAAGRG